MAGLFDVDLIPRILSVDKKIRLSSIDKRREKQSRDGKGSSTRRTETVSSDEKDREEQGTINITV